MTQSPASTHTLFGHTKAEAQLVQAWRHGRLPNALLITGPKGIGKATLAYRLARFLLSNPRDDGLLPREDLAIEEDHPVAQRIAAGSHGDLMAITPQINERTGAMRSEIVVDDTRRVGEFFSLSAAEGHWRIVLIDSADALNRNAANSLLKALEEPPKRALLLLISHNPGRLLPTIRSRCQTLRLQTPPEEAFAHIVETQSGTISEHELHGLYMLAGGSPGKALELAHTNALESYIELLELLSGSETIHPEKLLYFIDSLSEKKAEGSWPVWDYLFRLLLQRVVYATHSDHKKEVFQGEAEQLRIIAGHKDAEEWLELAEEMDSLLTDTERLHLDKRQTLQLFFHRIEGLLRAA